MARRGEPRFFSPVIVRWKITQQSYDCVRLFNSPQDHKGCAHAQRIVRQCQINNCLPDNQMRQERLLEFNIADLNATLPGLC
jgi:hypothetical protein